MESEFRARAFHPLWKRFPTSCTILHRIPCRGPATPTPKHWFGLFPVRSPLLGESRLFSFPPGTEMFHFPGYCSSHPMDSGVGNQAVNLTGFSHSEISGSTPICGSPKLFAAYHVLLRHSMPRHSPCALSNLTKFKIQICLSRCNLCIPYLCNFQRTVVFPACIGAKTESFMSTSEWWAYQDSNLGPRPYQGRALTN